MKRHSANDNKISGKGDLRRINDKRQRIINGAIKIFARKGFYNAKVSEIAREAGVADGTIYLYFKSKDDILITLFEDRMDWVIAELTEYLANETEPKTKLRKLVGFHYKLLTKHRDLLDVLTIELRQSSKFMKEYNNVKFKAFLNIIGDIVREGQLEGCFRQDISPDMFKRAFYGAVDALALQRLLSPRNRGSFKHTMNELIEMLIRGISVDSPPAT